MGLSEQIRLGARLQRYTKVLQTSPDGSGSVDLGSSYILLSIEADKPCRVRLYDNEASMNDSVEKARLFGNTNVQDNIALVGDISMSAIDTKLSIDPAMYGMSSTPADKLSYYKIDSTASGQYPNITFTTFLLEDFNVLETNRRTLPQIYANVAPSVRVTGSIFDVNIPTTFLLVSASVTPPEARARIRLYSTSGSLSNAVEVSRSFASESLAGTDLIVDAIITGSSTLHFVPKIIGANLQNVDNNLENMRGSLSLLAGYTEMYYIVENVRSVGGAVNMTASLHVLAIED